MEIVKMIIVLIIFMLFFLLLNKLEKSEKINSELIRKILHIGSGFGGLVLPFLFKRKNLRYSIGNNFSYTAYKHKNNKE